MIEIPVNGIQNPAYRFAAAQYALSLTGRGFFVLVHLFTGSLVLAISILSNRLQTHSSPELTLPTNEQVN